MISTLVLAIALQAPGQASPQLVPDSVLRPPGGPEYVFLPSPDARLSSVRVSVQFVEEPGERGASAILLDLARQRAAPLARAAGIRFEGARTPWGLRYTVTGPTADFERLGETLRAALAAPETDRTRIRRAQRKISAEIEPEYETPRGTVSRTLRQRISPDDATLRGTPASLQNIDGAILEAMWGRTHTRASLQVLVASPAPRPVVFATLRELGSPRDPGVGMGLAPPAALPPPETQVLRQWLGLGYRIDAPDDPAAEILALVIADALDESTSGFGYETWVELRQTVGHKILILAGAAYADRAGDMRRRVRGVLQEVSGTIEEGDVRRFAEALARTALESARTPSGRVEFVGRHLDASGSVDGAVRYLDVLESVDAARVRALATTLLGTTPEEVEIR